MLTLWITIWGSSVNMYWEIKIPLILKIFLLFHSRIFLLTKDNLVKRNCKKCKYDVYLWLRWDTHILLLILYSIFFSYNLPPPTNIIKIFGNFLNRIYKKIEKKNMHRSSTFTMVDMEFAEFLDFFTRLNFYFFCRLHTWPHIGSNHVPFCSHQIEGNLWLVAATGWSLKMSLAELTGWRHYSRLQST
jgi:hypothetical protein